jgi:hypothetical protein
VGGTAALSATGGASGNPVVFSLDSSSVAGVYTLSSTNCATVNYTGAGDCVIDADQAGDSNCVAAPQVQQTVVVGRAGSTKQTVTFAAISAKTLLQSPLMLTATASSG